ncbi:SpoIIE family protein phosphatase [Algivirga pacifica]|uniref:Response regulatory domain-containing protein n=1 Tax=Algivirga pacifica TaxID=1162670 RepID=A0ABP9D6V6_9BACT
MKRAILCVDDERIILTGLKKQLKTVLGSDFIIETAESGDEGLEVFDELKEDGYDIPVVITDYIMPGMKGDEFLKNIHQRCDTTINILLTGQADTEAVGSAVNAANLYRYIPKPWEPEDVQLTVKEAIQKYDAKKQIELQHKELESLNRDLEFKVIERTEELQATNEELQSTNEELFRTLEVVNEQKEEIERKNLKILNSIQYAQRIQKAVLPDEQQLEQHLQDHFVFFRPRDIVSGDFYWSKSTKERTFVTVADCTGHGVPGAFMSMMGVAFLNQIDPLCNAADYLETLRNNVKHSLGQNGSNGEQQDGMDIAFCIIEKENNLLHFASAHNTAIILRKAGTPLPETSEHIKLIASKTGDTLIEIKGNRQPIGIYPKEKPFVNLSIPLHKGDMIYLASDGFADQIGGPNNKKFLKKNLKGFLFSIFTLPVAEQKEILEVTFERWKAEQEQIDDVAILGFRI